MSYLEDLKRKLESGTLFKADISGFESKLFPDFVESPESSILIGEAASPGAASGRLALTNIDVEKYGEVILLKEETKAEDIPSIRGSKGVIAIKGGVSSHAAIISRGYGIPCITGCQDIKIKDGEVDISGHRVRTGDYISFKNGHIYLGQHKVTPGIITSIINDSNIEEIKAYQRFLETIKKILDKKGFVVKSNSDDPLSARTAKILGANGIGVVRTEHMFFDTTDQKRLIFMLKMLMADSSAERRSALSELYLMQVKDFEGIFNEVKPYQVTIRLLDPPLNEFIPDSKEELEILAGKLNISAEEILKRKRLLDQQNPMMGYRGVRLAISHPEIYEMQVRAIFAAAKSQNVKPEIMIPLVADPNELKYVDSKIINPLSEEFKIEYSLACMIEVPRATEEPIVKRLAEIAETLSFGTNDLTQYHFGLDRSGLSGFLKEAEKLGTMPGKVFETIDRDGIGNSIRRVVNTARKVNNNVHIGVCGEHGGDPESIIFFIREAGLNYVSCSPFRVPVALLAAAYSFTQT